MLFKLHVEIKKTMAKILYLAFALILIVSCKGKTDSGDESSGEAVPQTPELVKAESEIEKRISNTDLQENLEIVNSLYFTKEDGSSLEVKAFLDKSQAILKVEEKYVDKDRGTYGTNLFYIHNGKKYASKERFEETADGKTYFVERVSFYDEKEKVINTKIRKAEFEEDLDSKIFEQVAMVDCSIKRAMDAINQEGEFETRFQGFVNSGNDNFITVGKTADGYISALMMQYKSTLTNKLIKNQEQSVGKKLDIEFQKMIDENGFEFQILLSVKEAK